VRLPFGLPDMEGMVGGPSLDLVDNIQEELMTFAQASRQIQQTLLSRPLLIVINGFYAFEEQTEGDTVVRDEPRRCSSRITRSNRRSATADCT